MINPVFAWLYKEVKNRTRVSFLTEVYILLEEKRKMFQSKISLILNLDQKIQFQLCPS